MASLLEESGISLVAENSSKFIEAVRHATSSVAEFGKKAVDVGKAANSYDFGFAIGATLKAGAGAAVGALAGLAGAFSAVAAVTVHATQKAMGYADAIDRIQAVTGLSAQWSQKLYAGSVIAGQGVNIITDAFGQLANRLDQAKDVADGAMGGIGDNGRQLARLIEDHARSIADANAGLIASQQALNEQLQQQSEDYYRTLGRLNEDYERDTLRSRSEFETQMADMAASHAEKVAETQSSLAQLQTDFAREEQERQRDLEQTIIDQRAEAARQIVDIQTRANDEQTNAATALANDLSRIDEAYAQKRQGILERIADPSTNPIMRAFLRRQLNGLGAQQTGEVAAANAKYQQERQRITDKANFEIAETQRKLAEQEAAERAKDARDAANAQRTYARQLADLQSSLVKENAEYDKQTIRLNAAFAQREDDARRSNARQLDDLNRAHDQQLAQAQAQSARLLAETARRLEDEKRQYDRQIEDMASSGGGAATRITPLTRAFKELGIDIAAFQKLKPDEQFDVLRAAIDRLGEGPAFTILSDLFGPSRADEIMNFYAAMKMADEVDAPFTAEDIANMQQTQREFNLIKLEADLLWAKIGKDLMPIVKELLAQFKVFWKEHGPEVIASLREFFSDTVPKVVQAIKDLVKWIKDDLVPAIKDISTWITQAGKDFDAWWVQADSDAKAVTVSISDFFEGARAMSKRSYSGMDDDTKEWARKAAFDVATFFGGFTTGVTKASTDIARMVIDVKARLDGFFEGVRVSIANFVTYGIDSLTRGITGVKDAFQRMIDKVGEFSRSLLNLTLPWWLTPGSPTPLESGLVGIRNALAGLEDYSGTLDLTARAKNVAGGTSGRQQVASAASIYEGARNWTTSNTTQVSMPVTINATGPVNGQRVADDMMSALTRAGVRLTR